MMSCPSENSERSESCPFLPVNPRPFNTVSSPDTELQHTIGGGSKHSFIRSLCLWLNYKQVGSFACEMKGLYLGPGSLAVC